MESLINPVGGINKIMDETDVDRSIVKVAIMGVLGVLSAGVLGFFLNLFIEGNSGAGNAAGFFGIVFLVLFLLQALFLKSEKIINLILFLESLGISAFFFNRFSLAILSAWFFLLFFLWEAARAGRQELDNRLKISFFHIDRRATYKAITALSIFISIAYASANGFSQSGISEKGLEAFLKPAEPLIQKLEVSDFSFQMTVYQLADSIITNQAAEQFGLQAGAVPASLKSEAVNKTLVELKNQAFGYGISFKNSDTILKVIQNYLNNQLDNIPSQIRAIIPFGFGLLIFLTIKGFGFIIRWLVAIPAYILYQLSLLTGFSRLALESRTKEIIILK